MWDKMAKKYFDLASWKSLAGVGNTAAVGMGLEVQTALKPSQIHKNLTFILICIIQTASHRRLRSLRKSIFLYIKFKKLFEMTKREGKCSRQNNYHITGKDYIFFTIFPLLTTILWIFTCLEFFFLPMSPGLVLIHVLHC